MCTDQQADAVMALAKLRRVTLEQCELLELALHALRHDRDHVTDEYLERSIESLRKIAQDARLAQGWKDR
jgi:hypothetical protein